MKHLLSPAGKPNTELLNNQFGLSGCATYRNRSQFEKDNKRILQYLVLLTSGEADLVETQELENGISLRVCYEFNQTSKEIIPIGSVSFSYKDPSRSEEVNSSFIVRLSWDSLNQDIEKVVNTVNSIWSIGSYDALYVYDEDDFTIQNMKMAFALEHYGLNRSQVNLIKRGITEEIEIKYNPGYMENRNGLLVSVQWLTFWNESAQNQICKNQLSILESVSDLLLTRYRGGGVRIRLSEKPGAYDDVTFHKRQLECRRKLEML